MSKNMQLHWSVKDKKRPLDGVVELDELRFYPKNDNDIIDTGAVFLKINQQGIEFIKDIYRSILEVRWPDDSDNPFDILPVFRFRVDSITKVTTTKEPGVYIEAQVSMLWHPFLEQKKN